MRDATSIALIVLLATQTALAGPSVDAGRGPVPVHVPVSYDPETPAPLVVLLHGYQTSGAEIEAWFQLTPLAEEHGFLLIYPTGMTDIWGLEYWNATDACCAMFGGNPDDSGYLRALVEAVEAGFSVDERRIYFVGHSNGGFMSYRMACDHADLVAAVASLAGATWLDPLDCDPSEPVHVLQIHGTSDAVVAYGGGTVPFGGAPHPGAVQTVETWAMYDGCAPTTDTSDPPLDLSADIPGAESTVTRYDDGCAAGGSARLWTIPGGPHSPNFSGDFNDLVVDFLLAHPKPAACPADTDGNGMVNVDDLVNVVLDWGTDGAANGGDTDDNAVVNVDDLVAVITAWGPC